MCGVARQGAAGKALSAQGFFVVVGRPRETFTEKCREVAEGEWYVCSRGCCPRVPSSS